MPKKIILASTSIYRKQLLEKTGLIFTIEKPSYDEEKAKLTAQTENRTALQIAEILSKGKAKSLWNKADNQNNLLIIAGDQLVHFKGQILGKSKNFETAFAQLQRLNNQTHELITALTLVCSEKVLHLNHITTLKMKNLTVSEIENYLKRDQPYDCAGSYKIEESGITLFEKIDCSDFTAVQGIPMIWMTNQLKELGYEFFQG